MNVDVEHAGRAYRVKFWNDQPGARCLGVWRKAGKGETSVDQFDVTGMAVVRAAREKMAK